ncbi:MAG TPA: hypothetical protein VJO53_08655 [Candidatus Acidoferrales bacterium]|nr:hypothetical protein [Candidatus Acidoferrales bacterium]
MDKRTRAILKAEPAASVSHHKRRCSVCRHPERDAIEEAFLHWESASKITNEFQLPGRTAIYRHARAYKLFDRRNRNVRFALGYIIEEAESVKATADNVIRAVCAYARINDAGEWVNPPSHVIVSSGSSADREGGQQAGPGSAEKDPNSQSPLHQESHVTSNESLPLTATQVETKYGAAR